MSGLASFSSSSSFSYGFTYDVFLSFRGDSRHGFTGNLYKALHDRGIHTFIDDKELQRGEQITPSLIKAIEESRIYITVLSKNYASSSFCLDELSKIIECVEGKGRLVLPVFYDVDPSHVRHQRGSYGEAMARHEEKFKDNMEKVQNWRKALHQVANLSGWHFKLGNEYEYEFIWKIVKEVSNKINRAPLHVADYPVGLESRVLKVNSLLDIGSDDGVHMVGIYGIGGIGKTTVARAVYNLITDQFEGLCFLDDVRENSIKHGIVHLQEMFLYEIVGENIKLGSVNKGISIIKHRLQRKKVLLILDDVDELEQLRAIVGGLDWFGSGSRVIITTRDKHLLASRGVERKYELEVLNEKEALELLSWNAFKYDKVDPSYMDILNQAVTYASGLPLALEVMGSNLFGKRLEEWESALDRYKRIPNKKIQKILKVSFDALEEDEQKIFLDIACCFKGYGLTEVEDILRAHYGVCKKHGIGVLVDKSLIKISGYRVTLHDLTQDMGREIVRQESPEKPGKRSRLWHVEDIIQVLEDNTGIQLLQLSRSIVMLPKLDVLTIWECDLSGSSKQNEGEDQVSLMVSSNAELFLSGCSVSDEFIPIILGWFSNVKHLDLSRNNFTTLPACIKECCFLRELNLDGCKLLREIRGIPPNIEILHATNCTSLTSSCRSMLLNKELHEQGGDKMFHLEGTKIPEWFEHCSRELPISFWFRNKFPAISLCVVIELVDKHIVESIFFPTICPKLIVNGSKDLSKGQSYSSRIHVADHIYIFDLKQIKFEDSVDEVFIENEWNHVVFTLEMTKELVIKQSGIHVFKQSSMEDIRFTDPLLLKEEHRSDTGVSTRISSTPTVQEDQFVSNDESTLSDEGCHVMESDQRTGKWEFCLCAIFSSLLSLCSSSCSLDAA